MLFASGKKGAQFSQEHWLRQMHYASAAAFFFDGERERPRRRRRVPGSGACANVQLPDEKRFLRL